MSIRPETAMTLAGVRISYNHCGVCGHTPDQGDLPNHAPLRWWDPDDGWKIGTLCPWCADDVLDDRPKPGDFAYVDHAEDVCTDEPDTDEDPLLAL